MGFHGGSAPALLFDRRSTPEQHIDVEHPGQLVGIDSFYVERLRGTEGANYAWAELVIGEQGNPVAKQTSKLARRVAQELKAAGWQLERLLSDNGNEFKGDFTSTTTRLNARHSRIHAGRPQTNGNVEALHKTILDCAVRREGWSRPLHRRSHDRRGGLLGRG